MSAAPRPRPALPAIAAVVALLAGCLALTATARRRASAVRATWPAEADLLYLPSAATLRALSLGHTELFADLVAARANVYFGSQIAAKTPQRHLERYIQTAVDLDPRFRRMYLSGAAMLVYHGGRITVDDVLAATKLLDRGRGVYPDDWEIAFQSGFNKMFELPKLVDENDRRIATWRQQGIEALREATLKDQGPAWMSSMVANLLTKRGSQDMAIRHLEQSYATTSSEETRDEIRRRLVYLYKDRSFSKMAEEQRQFADRVKAAYDYAPEAFSVVAGPRRPHTIQLDVLARPPSSSAPR